MQIKIAFGRKLTENGKRKNNLFEWQNKQQSKL